MLILNSLSDDIVNQGKWLYEQCYDKYSIGHCIILQGYLSLEWHRSFKLIELKEEVKEK